jgi:hypothetical protein
MLFTYRSGTPSPFQSPHAAPIPWFAVPDIPCVLVTSVKAALVTPPKLPQPSLRSSKSAPPLYLGPKTSRSPSPSKSATAIEEAASEVTPEVTSNRSKRGEAAAPPLRHSFRPAGLPFMAPHMTARSRSSSPSKSAKAAP